MKYKELGKEVRFYHNLSDQDFGAFVDEATLFNCEGRWVLRLAAGYQVADEEDWYELEAEPTKWPVSPSDEPIANPGTDQSEDCGHGSEIFDTFGVNAKEIEPPTAD